MSNLSGITATGFCLGNGRDPFPSMDEIFKSVASVGTATPVPLSFRMRKFSLGDDLHALLTDRDAADIQILGADIHYVDKDTVTLVAKVTSKSGPSPKITVDLDAGGTVTSWISPDTGRKVKVVLRPESLIGEVAAFEYVESGDSYVVEPASMTKDVPSFADPDKVMEVDVAVGPITF